MSEPFIDQYLHVAFHLDRHIPGYIDAYFGDQSKRDRALAETPVEPAALASTAANLQAELASASLPDDRKDYLLKQLAAMHAQARKLSGEVLPYVEEVTLCFDISPERVPDDALEADRAALDDLLPGSGDLSSRMNAWRDRAIIDADRARAAIDLILAETRHRTAAFVDLPAGESVEIAFVRDKPWRGYNWYLGDRKSRVELNIDLPIYANQLVDLIAHEAYPGHHTEHCLKGEILYRDRGYEEMSIQLINTPECVIHEGIATTAASIIFPGDEEREWVNSILYPTVGLDPLPPEAMAISEHVDRLQSAAGNAALMRHVDQASDDEVVTYLMHYALVDIQRARHRLRFIDDPLWRPYIFSYHVGRDLLRDWFGDAGQERRIAMFRELLTGQHTPSRLRRESALQSNQTIP
ncbi:MAG: hypothetical protein AB7V46_01875 [Thermomicrobiales bacterium]